MSVHAITVLQHPLPGMRGPVVALKVCPICGHVLRSHTWMRKHLVRTHGVS
jgi:ribosomal protein L32